MRLAAILGLLLITGLGFWVCQEYVVDPQPKPSYEIAKPIAGLQTNDSVFTFFSTLGFEHTFSSGSTIKIPKRSIINANGEFVDGLIELRFKVYQDALDLFFDGILMDQSDPFNMTAGGFKIGLSKQGKPLFLDPTQVVEIELAGFGKEKENSLYFLNRETNKWDSILNVSPIINPDYVELERAIKRMKPDVQFPLNQQYFALNYKGILDAVYDGNFTNVNHQRTQLKMKNYGLRWKEIEIAPMEIESYHVDGNAMVWRNVSRKVFPQWTKNKPGRLEKLNASRYRLIVEDVEHDKKFSTQIEVVLPLETLFNSGPGYWKKEYESKVVRLENALEKQIALPDSYRSFSFNQLGTYVWQKTLEEEISIRVYANFKDSLRSVVKENGFYFLSGDLKILKHYTKNTWKDFLFLEDSKSRIFSIASDEQIHFLPIEQLTEIDFQQLKKMNNPSYNFKLQTARSIPKSKFEFLKLFEN